MTNPLLLRVTKLELENSMLRQQIVKLEKTRPQITKRIELEIIIDMVYETTGFGIVELRNQHKPIDISIIRQCVVYLLYKYAYMNKSSIAKYMCRHHTSIMYTIERVDSWHKYPASYVIEMTMFNRLEDLIIEKIKTI
jgi:chromosomal replication initiation ATPase DnaA